MSYELQRKRQEEKTSAMAAIADVLDTITYPDSASSMGVTDTALHNIVEGIVGVVLAELEIRKHTEQRT